VHKVKLTELSRRMVGGVACLVGWCGDARLVIAPNDQRIANDDPDFIAWLVPPDERSKEAKKRNRYAARSLDAT
jgi:hypothetical protein